MIASRPTYPLGTKGLQTFAVCYQPSFSLNTAHSQQCCQEIQEWLFKNLPKVKQGQCYCLYLPLTSLLPLVSTLALQLRLRNSCQGNDHQIWTVFGSIRRLTEARISASQHRQQWSNRSMTKVTVTSQNRLKECLYFWSPVFEILRQSPPFSLQRSTKDSTEAFTLGLLSL